ncbi:MAG: Holliday junction resolvase RuvX [Coriobacteriia bacterium]
MRVAALDIGEKRVGVAISDSAGAVATPHGVWDASDIAGDARRLREFIDEYEVGVLVVGIPYSLSGEKGPQARKVEQTAARLDEILDVPVVLFDERLSSAEARRVMRAEGLDERRMRGRIDKVAAAVMLQAFLDRERRNFRDDAEA